MFALEALKTYGKGLDLRSADAVTQEGQRSQVRILSGALS
jgi:hypothetical protein